MCYILRDKNQTDKTYVGTVGMIDEFLGTLPRGKLILNLHTMDEGSGLSKGLRALLDSRGRMRSKCHCIYN